MTGIFALISMSKYFHFLSFAYCELRFTAIYLFNNLNKLRYKEIHLTNLNYLKTYSVEN